MGNDQPRTLILLRGVQGSGKTSVASLITSFVDTPNNIMFAADDLFYKPDGSYFYDPNAAGHAHELCYNNAVEAMDRGEPLVVVHNTFSRPAELTPYLDAAYEREYRSCVLIVENRHNNVDVHGVPQEVREEFAENIKSTIKLI